MRSLIWCQQCCTNFDTTRQPDRHQPRTKLGYLCNKKKNHCNPLSVNFQLITLGEKRHIIWVMSDLISPYNLLFGLILVMILVFFAISYFYIYDLYSFTLSSVFFLHVAFYSYVLYCLTLKHVFFLNVLFHHISSNKL